MANKKTFATSDEEMGVTCEIKVKGHLDKQWSEWMGGMNISYDDEGNTLLSGHIPDQAALHGILGQIRDMGMVLLSIISKAEGFQTRKPRT